MIENVFEKEVKEVVDRLVGIYTVRAKEVLDDVLLERFAVQLGEIRMPKQSPFVRGRLTSSAAAASGGKFISLKDGESVVFAPLCGLEEMVRADMHEYWDLNPAIFHPCIGKDCPGCAVGNEARFKAYLPVWRKEDGEVVVYPFTIRVYRQLVELEDETEGRTLEGLAIKVKRHGSGLSTTYSVIGLGKRVPVDGVEEPDFVDWLGPQTEEDIVDLLHSKGFEIPGRDDVDDFEAGSKALGKMVEEAAASDDDDGWGDV